MKEQIGNGSRCLLLYRPGERMRGNNLTESFAKSTSKTCRFKLLSAYVIQAAPRAAMRLVSPLLSFFLFLFFPVRFLNSYSRRHFGSVVNPNKPELRNKVIVDNLAHSRDLGASIKYLWLLPAVTSCVTLDRVVPLLPELISGVSMQLAFFVLQPLIVFPLRRIFRAAVDGRTLAIYCAHFAFLVFAVVAMAFTVLIGLGTAGGLWIDLAPEVPPADVLASRIPYLAGSFAPSSLLSMAVLWLLNELVNVVVFVAAVSVLCAVILLPHPAVTFGILYERPGKWLLRYVTVGLLLCFCIALWAVF